MPFDLNELATRCLQREKNAGRYKDASYYTSSVRLPVPPYESSGKRKERVVVGIGEKRRHTEAKKENFRRSRKAQRFVLFYQNQRLKVVSKRTENKPHVRTTHSIKML
jgi:hypothetical protein